MYKAEYPSPPLGGIISSCWGRKSSGEEGKGKGKERREKGREKGGKKGNGKGKGKGKSKRREGLIFFPREKGRDCHVVAVLRAGAQKFWGRQFS